MKAAIALIIALLGLPLALQANDDPAVAAAAPILREALAKTPAE